MLYIKQVRHYRIRIKEFINTYSGKIIKIYQRYRLLSQDSLGLDEPYSTKKVLSSKDINIYNVISFKVTPNGPLEGKYLEIDSVSQNRLNAIKK